MAAKKKAKNKAKKRKTTALKQRSAKTAGKKVAAKRTAVKARPPQEKRVAARAPAPMPKPAAPADTARHRAHRHRPHYYSHLSVAILKLETGSLRVGDVIHIKGHTSDFSQPVESMEIDHVHVNEARPGQSFGLRVKEHAREHDGVYKAKS
jgi:putative protease